MRFHSILFDRPDNSIDVDALDEPPFFADLNLDQILASMTTGRGDYHLTPFFYAPLHDVAAVEYRHEILRDLEKDAVFASVGAFAKRMRTMRDHLTQAEKLRDRYQKERWFLDAVDLYRGAVCALTEELTLLDVQSRGFLAFRAYLTDYIASDGFRALAAETHKLQDDLASVTYCIHIKGNRVTVSTYDEEADYSAEVEETFATFKQGAVKDYRVTFPDAPDMNQVEERVLDLVARLYPAIFQALDDYRVHHHHYLDSTISAFDREVQFYVAYLAFIAPFKSAGLAFCYPHVSTHSKDVYAYDAFDLALAAKLTRENAAVVCNDVSLTGPERICVVTGPNQGGKTTFARMFGQLHYLASLGYPVPGRDAQLFLPDRLFTHFEKEEDLTTLRGKLEDELTRIHAILQQATGTSIIIMNESFSSTTLSDALFLGQEVLTRIIQMGLLGVYVTFVDELASLSAATVSMASTVVPDNAAVRTYKIVRKRADGLAYAVALAEKYGLTYESLTRRVAS